MKRTPPLRFVIGVLVGGGGVVAVEAVQGDAYAYQVLRGMSEEQQLLSSRGRRTASDRGIRVWIKRPKPLMKRLLP